MNCQETLNNFFCRTKIHPTIALRSSVIFLGLTRTMGFLWSKKWLSVTTGIKFWPSQQKPCHRRADQRPKPCIKSKKFLHLNQSIYLFACLEFVQLKRSFTHNCPSRSILSIRYLSKRVMSLVTSDIRKGLRMAKLSGMTCKICNSSSVMSVASSCVLPSPSNMACPRTRADSNVSRV